MNKNEDEGLILYFVTMFIIIFSVSYVIAINY